jgi:3-deoxy-manno-octulosonate cytidylyltransferase (CMP-KDO synthetase)
MKIIGVVPVRMAASRFPGKPLHLILGQPLLEHVFLRAKMYKEWSSLVLATCDSEIEIFSKNKNYPVIMTGDHHTRALDRVAEAVTLLDEDVHDNDIIVCVQGDEPMMRPDMIDAVVDPLIEDPAKAGTMLCMHITDELIWRNPDTVKVVHNEAGEVLYTSRETIPYCKGEFSPELMAMRVHGIFAFRWRYLREFTEHPETYLEKVEACDSNRILDMAFRQYIAPYASIPSFSVDSPEDVDLVEKHIQEDGIWDLYQPK